MVTHVISSSSPSTSQNSRTAQPGHVRGFTLVELLTVVVILAVLAMIAAPSLRELSVSQRVQMAAMDLNTSLLRARSEAIKQNTDVTLSPVGAWTRAGLWPSAGRISILMQRRATLPSAIRGS